MGRMGPGTVIQSIVWYFFPMSKCLIWMCTRRRFAQYQSTKHVFLCPCASIVFTRRTLVV